MSPTSIHASNTNEDGVFHWTTVDRIGLYKTAEDGQLSKNIWKDVHQVDAVKAVNSIPNTLTNPVYRDMAAKILLSDAPTDKKDDDLASPTLLIARLQKLINLGMIDEAEALYKEATSTHDKAPRDFGLHLINIQLSLANGGEIAPICLDIQAASADYRDMPAWRELSEFCRVRFGEHESIKLGALKFNHYPSLKTLLSSPHAGMAEAKTSMGVLFAHADNKFGNAEYNTAARTLANLSDLTIKTALAKRYAPLETYQCYAIEGAKRGIINAETLANLYKSASFSDNLMQGTQGEVTIHPCDVPAYFYQRLSTTNTDDKTVKTLVTALLQSTATIPARALSPMANYIKTTDLNNESPSLQWQAGRVLALNDAFYDKDQISDTILPLQSIYYANQLSNNDYLKWMNDDNHANLFRTKMTDPATPVYISQTITGEINNLANNKKKYEYGNFFSLTYGKKSLGLGLGFSDFLHDKYVDNNPASVFIPILSIVGNKDFDKLNSTDAGVILSALKSYKFKKNAVALGFEYLQSN